MSPFDDATRRAIVARANLAPSVHNTQPTRWRFEPDGAITILVDKTRFLPAADLLGRDTAISCGAAIEGTVIALGEHGLTTEVEPLSDTDAVGRLIPMARLAIRDGGRTPPLAEAIETRSTWRGGFAPANSRMKSDLARWASGREDAILATEMTDLEMLAHLNDEASLHFYAQDSYRHELVDWMRLSKSHPDYNKDGLNREALHLGVLEGHAAKFALGNDAVFGLLQNLKIAGSMLSESKKTLSSTAIVLFHRPADEIPLETGRCFYRLWLELALMGYGAWPMAVVADHAATARATVEHFDIGNDRRLHALLRIGVAKNRSPRSRLSPDTLIIT